MFTCELKINGNMAIHIYGHNEGQELPISSSAKGHSFMQNYIYKYEVYEIGQNKKTIRGSICHKRDNGLLELVRLIIEDYQKRANK